MAHLSYLLYLDADQQVRGMMTRVFSEHRLGGQLYCLSSASNALLYLNQLGPFKGSKRPDLIILDMELPHFEGGDFLQMLRTNTRFRSIALCAVSSGFASANLERCRTLGIQRYHQKPGTDHDALALLQAAQEWIAQDARERGK